MTEHEQSNEEEPESNYNILTSARYQEVISDRQGVGPTVTIERGDDEGMRAQYIERTERLIDKIRHGFDGPADVVFYLDKSARPVEWFVDSMWDVFKEEDGSIPEKPERKFMNIHAQESAGGARPDSQEIVEAVRRGDYDLMVHEMREVYPDMSGKNILAVDEVSVSGATEIFAYELFRRAFPDAHIKSAAWMQAGKKFDQQGNSFPVEIPVWYSELNDAGRGIKPLNADRSAKSNNLTQAKGAHILSSGLDGEQDLDAMRLRREFKQLAIDVKTGKQPIIPANDIDSSRYDSLTFRRVQAS